MYYCSAFVMEAPATKDAPLNEMVTASNRSVPAVAQTLPCGAMAPTMQPDHSQPAELLTNKINEIRHSYDGSIGLGACQALI